MTHKTHEQLVNDARTRSKVVALVYSPVELQRYIVEIITQDTDVFIKDGEQIVHFNSVEEALKRSQKFGAEEFFLCLDNTYDEFGAEGATAQQFDYIPIHSKYSRSVQ